MAAVTMPHGAGWDPNGRQYKCCCSSCHVKTGTLIIGILEAIGLGLNLISNIARFSTIGSDYTVSFVISIISFLVSIVVVALLFYALKSERAGFLIPHLVLQVIGIIILAILAVFAIILLVTGGGILSNLINQGYEEANKGTTPFPGYSTIAPDTVFGGVMIAIGVTLLITFALVAGLEIWFFLVVLNCYRFFKDQDTYGKAPTAGGVAYGAGPPQGYIQQGYPGPYSTPGNYQGGYYKQ